MAAIAEDLRRIPMSQRLGATLTLAAEYARAQHHGEVSLEHLLLALTDDGDAVHVLSASHVDSSLLKADISMFLSGLPSHPHSSTLDQLQIAMDLRRILEAAAAAASQGRRREINGAIVLAAIVGDGKSSAAHMLRAQGLTFEEAIKALQRALAPAPAAPQYDAEDVLANARARVQTRTMPGLAAKTAAQVAATTTLAAPTGEVARDTVDPPERERQTEAAPTGSTNLPVSDFRDAVNTELLAPEITGGQVVTEHDTTAPASLESLAAAPRHPQSTVPPQLVHEPHSADMITAPWPTETTAPYLSPQPVADHSADLPPLPGGKVSPHVPLDDLIPTARPPQEPTRASPPLRKPLPEPSGRWPAPVGPAWQPSAPVPPPLPQAGWHDPRDPWSELAAVEPQQSAQLSPSPPPLPPYGELDLTSPASDNLPQNHSDGPTHYDPTYYGADAGMAPEFGEPPHDQEHPGTEPSTAPGAPYGTEMPRDASTLQVPTPELASRPLAPLSINGVRPGDGTTRRAPIDKAVAGQLVENIPRRMRVHTPTEVEVRIANAEAARLIDGLEGNWHSHAITVAPAMSIKLRAPDGGFMIDGASRETQWIETTVDAGRDFALWRWTVTPLKSGRQRLQLLMSARTVDPSGLAADTMMPDQVVEITVATNYGRTFARAATWTTIAVAGGVAARFGDKLYDPIVDGVLKIIK